MSRKWLLFLFCLFVLIALAPLSHASLTLKVNDSATRVSFAPQATEVALAETLARKLAGFGAGGGDLLSAVE